MTNTALTKTNLTNTALTKTAFLFPGQGSQAVGMAQDILAVSPAAQAVMASVEDALGAELGQIMKDGPADDLKMTRNAQPALMASALCVTRALEEKTGKNIDQLGVAVAGHSLGEYAALAAVGALDVATTAGLLQQRGDAMQTAVPVGEGAMAALLGATIEQAEEIISSREWAALDIANDNAPGQVVISGRVADVDAAIALAAEMGIRKGVKLPVSAPFHCRLMAPAADVMANALAGVTLHRPSLPVYCNVTADEQIEPAILRENLIIQVTGMVRWRETLLNMAANGVERFVELGTGKVLTGLVKRTLPDAEALNIETPDDLDSVAAVL
ncbi:MAG: ACP S-malonyltransferase [Alphaproteobacteria bacterium]|nr:ACP S-malonyltransferase [Alphaproteobacteria bacterium]